MEFLHPGKFTVIDEMAEKAGFAKNEKILEVGCGYADSAAHLEETRGLSMTCLDTAGKVVRKAQERHPGLNVQYYNGYMIDFESKSFDGAFMECSFSLMERQEEILHELYCVLKNGAKLAISDLYFLDPDPERVKQAAEEAYAAFHRPHEERDCENAPRMPSAYCVDGMIVLPSLVSALEETGFRVLSVTDKSQELKNYVAQSLMDYGSFDAMLKAALPADACEQEFCNVKYSRSTGYFILLAEKP